MKCPCCGASLRLGFVPLEEAPAPAPNGKPALANGRADADAIRAVNRELDRYMFWGHFVRQKLGPTPSLEAVLSLEMGDFGQCMGPWRFAQLVTALLDAGVPAARIVESPLWRGVQHRHGWRKHPQFRELRETLESQL